MKHEVSPPDGVVNEALVEDGAEDELHTRVALVLAQVVVSPRGEVIENDHGVAASDE